MPDGAISEGMRNCQTHLHAWGRANGVQFDPTKESMHIVSRAHPAGAGFRVLGVDFDAKLLMHEAARACACQAGWRLRTLLRTRRYHNVAEMFLLFRSHILSFVGFRAPAIAHAATTVLAPIDAVYARFLHAMGLSEREALLHFHLVPLATRRDIAILGVLHRCALGLTT